MSDDQERAYMAMWAMWSAPLIMSNDLRSVKRSSKRLLLNKNVIRINQDELGVQARMVLEVKPASDNYYRPSLPGSDGEDLVILAFVVFE